MQKTATMSCCISTTDADCPLGIEIWIDDQQVFNVDHVCEPIMFNHSIDDAKANHELRFVMKNKTQLHTKIDADGQIVKDANLVISDIEFDEINIEQLFIDHSKYTHNFNDTQEITETRFYGELGCNGTLSLVFTTPLYLWLLERM